MNRLLYVRHGQSQSNADGILAGHTESPLTEIGRHQARIAGWRILQLTVEAEPVNALLSSPSSRALETAHIIADVIGYKPERIITKPLFKERNLGIYEGASRQLLQNETVDLDQVPGAEPRAALQERIDASLELIGSTSVGTVVLVGHSGYYRQLQTTLEPVALPQPIANGAVREHNLGE